MNDYNNFSARGRTVQNTDSSNAILSAMPSIFETGGNTIRTGDKLLQVILLSIYNSKRLHEVIIMCENCV